MQKVVTSLKEEQKFIMEKNSQSRKNDTKKKTDEVRITKNCSFKSTLVVVR